MVGELFDILFFIVGGGDDGGGEEMPIDTVFADRGE